MDKFLKTKTRTLLVTSSQESSTEPNCPTDVRNLCFSSSVPMGNWQGILLPHRHSFSTSATQKSHFLSWNTIAPTASHRPPAWKDEPFPCSNTKRVRLQVHKHKELFLLRTRSCPVPFAVISLKLEHATQYQAILRNRVIAAHAWKHRCCDAVGQGLKLVQGLSLDETVKNLNGPSSFGIKKNPA